MNEDILSGNVSNLGGKVEQAAGDLTGDAKLKTQGKFDEVSGQVQAGVGRAKDNLRSTIDSLSDQAKSAASGMQDQVGNAGDTIGAMVKEQPLAALLTATAVGYLLAFLIHRR